MSKRARNFFRDRLALTRWQRLARTASVSPLRRKYGKPRRARSFSPSQKNRDRDSGWHLAQTENNWRPAVRPHPPAARLQYGMHKLANSFASWKDTAARFGPWRLARTESD